MTQGHEQDRPPLRGAGGKGGGGGGSESADTLRTAQVAELVDLLGEGEIEGLTNGLRSIYFDGVPLQNADSSFNFEGVQVVFTPGTQGQASITGADGVQSELSVGVDVLAATPVVRTITNPAVDKARVTIALQQLSETDPSNGDLRGSSFEWAIDVQSAGGGFVEVTSATVSGKTMSRSTLSKVFALTGPAPWDIRVRRVSPDALSSYTVNKFAWSSYTAIQSLRLRHPNSAMVRTRINAQQFARIPVRSFDLMGLRVQVPSNYNPRTKVYTGIWDGTFTIAWTDCPAWIYYALVTNSRFGLGRYFATTPALKWQMYTIGQYCDAMVPDGRGGTEPRFRCGLVLSTREQAFKVIADMAAVFRGMAYWAGSDVTVVQDAPADATVLFTPANVVGGQFTYASSSHSKRHSQVTVWFNDLAQHGKLVPEVVVDRARERRFGVRPLELSPLGCWSRGQARRLAKWVLYSEEHEGATVSHRVGLDGVLAPPGSVFQVADPNEAGERLGGRVSAATTTAVTLDAPVTLASGESYLLTVMLPDLIDPTQLVPEQRAVTSGAGTISVLAVVAFSAPPPPQAVWILQSSAVQATSWRCLSVAEVPDTNEFEITGLRHYPGKYALIEEGTPFEPPPVSRISARPPAPAALLITETVYSSGASSRSRVTVSWDEPAAGLTYVCSWRLQNGPWTDLPLSTGNCFEVDGLQPGLFEARVHSVNGLGNRSVARPGSLLLLGEAGAGVKLVLTQQVFTFDGVGVPRPAAQQVGIAVQRVNLVGAVIFTAKGYDAAGGSETVLTLTGTGDARALDVLEFGAFAYAVVRVELDLYADERIVGRVQDGVAGYALRLSNQAHTMPAGPTGAASSYAGAETYLTIYKGQVDDTAAWAITHVDNGLDSVRSATQGGVANAAGRWWRVVNQAADAGRVSFTATKAGAPTLTDQFSTALSRAGTPGLPGTSGTQSGVAYLYQWNAGTPGDPSGASTFTWATAASSAYTGGAGWQTTPPANPGTAGLQLWLVSKGVSDVAGAPSTSVSWASGFAKYAATQNGQAGSPGLTGFQYATPTVYAWAIGAAPTISGAAIYTWAGGGSFNLTPSGWAVAPGVPPAPGYTLFGATVSISDVASNATTGFTWTTASVSVRGYAGADGAAGGAGIAGASARYCYQRVPGNPAPVSGFVTTGGSSSFPTDIQSNATWGINLAWVASDPNTGSTDTLYQSDGIYSPASGNTVWSTPYISSLKVGSLSAVSVNTGALNVTGNLTISPTSAIIAGAGYGAAGGWFAGYSGGAYKLSLGNLLTFDGATLAIGVGSITGLGSLATQSSVDYGSVTGTKPPASATPHQVFRDYNPPGGVLYPGDTWFQTVGGGAGKVHTWNGVSWVQQMRGPVNANQGGHTAWSDTVANAVIADRGAGPAQPGDIVTLHGPGFSKTRMYNMSNDGWVDIALAIDGNVVVDGTLRVQSLIATTLSSIRASLGTATIDSLGWLRSAGVASWNDATPGVHLGWDTDAHKFRVGDGTSYMRWSPATGPQIAGATISGGTLVNPDMGVFTASIPGGTISYQAYSQLTTLFLGSRTVEVTGGTGTKTYNWTASDDALDSGGSIWFSGQGTPTVLIYTQFPAGAAKSVHISVNVADANGRIASAGFRTQVTSTA